MQGTLSRRNTAGREKEEASVACHYLCEGNISTHVCVCVKVVRNTRAVDGRMRYVQVATPAAFFARNPKAEADLVMDDALVESISYPNQLFPSIQCYLISPLRR